MINTANVTDMSDMFAGCSSLTSLDLSNFNTANVTNMYGMFYDCRSMASLDLSHFDMSNVTYKGAMCQNLSITSGACTITCPTAVENAIKETDPNYNPSNPWYNHGNYYLSGLPTSGVTFTWLRPTSK